MLASFAIQLNLQKDGRCADPVHEVVNLDVDEILGRVIDIGEMKELKERMKKYQDKLEISDAQLALLKEQLKVRPSKNSQIYRCFKECGPDGS